MKKIIVLIAALAISSGAFAQGFSWGIKAGLNVTGVSGSDLETKSKTGFHAGVVTEFGISDWFAIAPELMYSSQGAKMDVPDMDIRVKGDYLNLPIMAKFYVLEKLSLEAGPQFGYALSMKVKAEDESEKMDSDLYNAFDMSLGVGATYNFGSFFASARYNFGLTDVVKEASNKNSVFQISVGYKF